MVEEKEEEVQQQQGEISKLGRKQNKDGDGKVQKRRKKEKKSTNLCFQFSSLGWNTLLEQHIGDDGVELVMMEWSQ